MVSHALDQADLTADFTVTTAKDIAQCAAPWSLALQGVGRASYVFCGLNFPEDIADLMATCRCYLSAPGGWIEDARPCGRLRFCLRTRIPAAD